VHDYNIIGDERGFLATNFGNYPRNFVEHFTNCIILTIYARNDFLKIPTLLTELVYVSNDPSGIKQTAAS